MSQLEHVSDLETHTRNGAVQEFTMSDDEYDLLEPNNTVNSSSSLSSTTKNVLLSPALIFKDRSANAEPPLPEEDFVQKQTWQCYGSTEVEYLLLRNTNNSEEPPIQQIAAVAPNCTGISYRKIWTDNNLVITSGSIGVLNVVVEASSDSVGNRDGMSEKDGKKMQKNLPFHSTTTSNTEDRLSKPGMMKDPSMESAKEMMEKYGQVAKKVQEQMKYNVHWLYDNVADGDFLQRMVVSGNKVIQRIPHTLQQTQDHMGKLYQRWKKAFGGDDDPFGK
jgi:hypothetical protein